jgi:5-formyltetrahydrofolate cyclo-ligase
MKSQEKARMRAFMKPLRQELHRRFPEAPLALKNHLWPLLQDQDLIGAYYPMGSELSLLPLIESLFQEGKTVALPCLSHRGDHALCFRLWNKTNPLEKAPRGFWQPSSSTPLGEPMVVLVPTLAFDLSKHRLGYGQGHYDRWIKTHRNMTSLRAIGIAYEGQRVTSVPCEDHDMPLDYMVTEHRVYG